METMAWTDERLEERFDGIDRRFDEVDRKFEAVDQRFDEIDRQIRSTRPGSRTSIAIDRVRWQIDAAWIEPGRDLGPQAGSGSATRSSSGSMVAALFGVIAAILAKGG